MLVQEKNIKGFNLLELIVVIVIVGIISATAYPNFSKWKKEREVRQGAAKIQSLIKNINAQIERGTFAFVQVLIRRTDNALTVQSKGMTMQNLATRINDGGSGWNINSDERCPISPTSPYWDTDATDPGDIGNYVYEISLEDVTTDISEGSICFSKGGKFYHTDGDLNPGFQRNFIYVCRRDFSGDRCALDVETGTGNNWLVPEGGEENDDFYKTVNWTRFGNVTISKMNNEYNDEGVFSGGTWIDLPYTDSTEDDDEDEDDSG